MSKDFKLIDFIEHEKMELERIDYQVPHYEDLTQLWELTNLVQHDYIVEIDGVKYKITYIFKPKIVFDKCSTPIKKSDWYGAIPFFGPHDVNFSVHYLKQFEINSDKGFRITNLLFRECIDWKIKQAVKRKKISKFRAFFWQIKKRLWYRSVNSIIGQGLYVNGSPDRGYHGKYSTCTITELP